MADQSHQNLRRIFELAIAVSPVRIVRPCSTVSALATAICVVVWR
jgi:hypothetical protein